MLHVHEPPLYNCLHSWLYYNYICMVSYEGDLKAMNNTQYAVEDPRAHVNQEPRDDLKDVVFGFGGMLAFMTIVFFGMVIIKFVQS